MKKNKNISIIFLILCFIFNINCQSFNNNSFIKNYILYKQSQKKLREKKFEDAIATLEKIKNNNLVLFDLDKVYINLIYAYYKNLNFDMAKKNILIFMRLYPNHLNIDYIIYLKCLIEMNMDIDTDISFKFLPIFYHKSNPIYAISAFFQLKNFIYQYPKSVYVTNAQKDLIYLKNRLSEHDFKILKFYFLHKKYISVIRRGEEIIQKYPETAVARQALIYIKKSYLALKIFDTAKKISQIILLNQI